MIGQRASNAAAAAVLAILAITLSWHASERTTAALGDSRLRNGFAWFGEPLRIQRFVDHQLDHELLSIDTPFEPLIVRAPVRAWLRVMPDSDPVDVLRGFTAGSAGLWAALVFVTFTVVGCGLVDAVLFTLIAIASAAAQFWLAVPASAAIASVSTLVAVLVVATGETGRAPREWQTTLGVVSSLAVRLVDGVFGVVVAHLVHGRRRGVQVIVNGIGVALLLWPVQRTLYPMSGPPPGLVSDAPARIVTAIVDAAIMPVNSIVITDRGALLARGIGYGWIGLVGAAAWLALLAIGVSYFADGHRRLGIFLSIVAAARLLVGWSIGEPTFHAALDVLPLLATAGAVGTLTRHRRTVRVLALVLLAAMVVNQRMAIEATIALLGGGR